MISSCSSCNDKTSGGNGSTTENLTDNGDNTDVNSLDKLPETEQVQYQINRMIEQELGKSNSSKSGKVEGIIAGFELGTNTRQVKVHMLRLKQKDLLVRVQKSANLFTYMFPLKLKSGKSNTSMNFEYNRSGGLFRATCVPNMLKGVSKSKLIKEVAALLTDWYGEPSFVLTDNQTCSHYIWVKGNRHVDLHCTSKGVEFVYTDLNSKIPANIPNGGADRPNVKTVS